MCTLKTCKNQVEDKEEDTSVRDECKDCDNDSEDEDEDEYEVYNI